ncbi:MAG: DUF401 family protein [Promethearchaeota archaeon]
MIPVWISSIIIIAIIIIFSKKELSLVLILAAIILAILTGVNLLFALFNVLTDLSLLLLLIVVILIPILGGIMDESGLMLELIQKMNISKRTALMLAPAFFGLLPIAGGALMSAPLIEEIDSELIPSKKIAINVWYRHILIFIYPLSVQLIVSSILANIPLYTIILALIIPTIIMFFAGYFLLIYSIEGSRENMQRDIRGVIRNLIPLIIAPLIDFLGRTFFPFVFPEIFLIIGLWLSILMAIKLAQFNSEKLIQIIKKMKIWRFPLLILAIFLFLEIFLLSGIPQILGNLHFNLMFLLLIGFGLGFITGRVQLPLSILIPIYLIQNGLASMLLLDFVLLYWSTFLGYLITPVHPCLAYSIDYFKMNYKGSLKHLILPTIICMIIIFSVLGLFSL